ncbi:MAG: nitroreductase [Flavihumibacter sp.]
MNTTSAPAIIDEVIRERRTVKPDKFNGKQIPDEDFREVLAAADWAPTHAYTEPWLFLIYAGEKAREACQMHAELYKSATDPEKFNQSSYDKFYNMGNNASHVVFAAMKRGNNPNIPAVEEIAAASAAIQNMLLAATARGIASFWSTGGMTLRQPLKDVLGLAEQDQVLGLLYFGYADSEPPVGKRMRPAEDKFIWK